MKIWVRVSDSLTSPQILYCMRTSVCESSGHDSHLQLHAVAIIQTQELIVRVSAVIEARAHEA